MRLLSLIFFLSLSSPLFAAEPFKVILDWYINPDHGPIIVAEAKGYFEEAGLDVEVIAPSDPSLPPKLVAAGEADLAVSYQQQTHIQIHEGLPLIRVGTLIATPLNCILVLDESPIKTLADLKGKKVGFSVAGADEGILTAVLAPHGLTLDDIELVNVNWSLSPSVMSGQVDAVIGAYRNFELIQMDINGAKGRCFYPEQEGVPAYDELIYVAKSDALDRDKITRFLQAVEKATQYIVNEPQASWELFAKSSAEVNDELNQRAWFLTLPRFALRPSALDVGRYRRIEQFLLDTKQITSINPVSKIAVDLGAK